MTEPERIDGDEPIECDKCGRIMVARVWVDHYPECEGPAATDGGGTVFDGVCPMCGQPYESYTSHLSECDP